MILPQNLPLYRLMREHKQLKHRWRSSSNRRKKAQALKTQAPNQVYSWDISYLPIPIKGIYFYLYMVMDIFIRENIDNSYRCFVGRSSTWIFVTDAGFTSRNMAVSQLRLEPHLMTHWEKFPAWLIWGGVLVVVWLVA